MRKIGGRKATFHLTTNDMEEIIKFTRKNYIALGLGLIVYAVYFQFTYAGNRVCDCETTENYSSKTGGAHTVNRFYHK